MLKILNFGAFLLAFIAFAATLIGTFQTECNAWIFFALSAYALNAYLKDSDWIE